MPNNGSSTAVKADGNAYIDTLLVSTWGGKTSFNTLANVGSTAKFWFLGMNGTTSQGLATVSGLYRCHLEAEHRQQLGLSSSRRAEADTWAMFAAGLLAVGAIARRRMQA